MATNGSTMINITVNATAVIADHTLALNGIGASLSILGAIFIYVTYAYIPEVRNFTRKLVLLLTTADLLSAVGYLIGVVHYVFVVKSEDIKRTTSDDDDDTDAICIIQSFLVIFSNLSAFFWTIIIAGHIFVSVVYQISERSTLCSALFHAIGWGLPGAIAITAAAYGVLGQDTVVRPLPWCFLRSQGSHTKLIVWTMITSVGWEILTYLVTSTLYVCLKWYLYRSRRLNVQAEPEGNVHHANSDESEQIQMRRDDRNFAFVWLILYVLKIWGTVRLFIITAHPKADSEPYYRDVMYVLLNIQSFATSSQAFWNCVIFCFCDKQVMRRICRSCCRPSAERQPLLGN